MTEEWSKYPKEMLKAQSRDAVVKKSLTPKLRERYRQARQEAEQMVKESHGDDAPPSSCN